MLCRFGWSRRQPAGAGHGLVERGVDAAVGRDLGQQALAVGRPQLLDLAVLQERVDDRATGRAAARATRRRWRSRSWSSSAASRPRSSNRISRSWGVELRLNVGRRRAAPRPASRLQSSREALVEPAQLVDVDADADVLHPGQHADERVLDLVVELAHALRVERRLERPAPGGRRPAPARAAALRVVDARRRRSRAGPRARRRSASVSRRVPRQQLVERVAGLGRVEQVGGDRRVELQSAAGRCRGRAATASAPWRRGPRTGRPSARAARTASVGEQRRPGSTPPRARLGVDARRPGRAAALRPSAPPHAAARSSTAESGRERGDGLGGRRRLGAPRPRAPRRRPWPARRPGVAERPRRAGRTACGTRGSRTAACTSSTSGGPQCSAVEVDARPGASRRSTITSALLPHLRLVLGQRGPQLRASARRGGRRCRRGRRRW